MNTTTIERTEVSKGILYIRNLMFSVMVLISIMGLSGIAIAADAETHGTGADDEQFNSTDFTIATFGPFLEAYKYVDNPTQDQGTSKSEVAEVGDILTFDLFAVNTGNAPAFSVSMVDYLPPGIIADDDSLVFYRCNGTGSNDTCNLFAPEDYTTIDYCKAIEGGTKVVCTFHELPGAYEVECLDPGTGWNGTDSNKTINVTYTNTTYVNYFKIEFNATVTAAANTTLLENTPNQINTLNVTGYFDAAKHYPINYNETDMGWDTWNDTDNRTSYVNLTILPNTTLSVTKGVNDLDADPGDTIIYTITVKTTSAVPMNVTVVDTLPVGFEPISFAYDSLTNYSALCLPSSYLKSNKTICTLLVEVGENGTGYINMTVLVHTQAAEGACACQPGAAGCSCCGPNVNTVSINGTNVYNPGANITANASAPPVDVNKPNLEVLKDTLTPFATPDGIVTYRIVIRNTGDGTAYDVVVNDTPPSGWVFSSITFNSSGCAGGVDSALIDGTVTFNTSSIAGHQTCLFTYDVIVPWGLSDGAYRNTLIMSGAKDGDNTSLMNTSHYNITYNNKYDNESYIDITINTNSELRVNKDIINNTIFEPNKIVTYKINISNLGDNTIHDLTALDLVPIGLDYYRSWTCVEGQNCVGAGGCDVDGVCKEIPSAVDTSRSNPYYNTNATVSNLTTAKLTGNTTTSGQNVLWTVGNVTNNSYRIIYLQLKITSSTPEGSQLNKVEVMAKNADGNDLLWKDVSQAARVGHPEMDIVKYLITADISPGDKADYRLIIKNLGDGSAINLSLVDDPDTGFSNEVIAGGKGNIKECIKDGVILTPSYYPICVITSGGSCTAWDYNAGAGVTYNSRPNCSTTASSSHGQPSYTCIGGILPSHTQCTIAYKAAVDVDQRDGTYINTVKLNSRDLFGTVLLPEQAVAYVAVTTKQKLVVGKDSNISGGQVVQPGDTISYTITIANPSFIENGIERAENISRLTIKDMLPPGFSLVSVKFNGCPTGGVDQADYCSGYSNYTPSSDGDSTILMWDWTGISSSTLIEVEGNITVTIVAELTSDVLEGSAENIVEVSAVTVAGTPLDGQASNIETVVKPRLSIIKESLSPYGNGPGENITFLIRVKNLGGGDAVNVSILDEMDAGFGTISGPYTAVIGNCGSISYNGSHFNLSDIGPYGTCVFTYPVKIFDNATNVTYQNTATVLYQDRTRTTVYNDSDFALTEVEISIYTQISKMANQSYADVGDVINFTIRVQNFGTSTLSNTTINDTLPDGFVFVNASPSATGISGQDVWWTNQSVPGQTTISYYILARATSNASDPSANFVTYIGFRPDGQNVTGNTTVDLGVNEPDLGVWKWTSSTQVKPGDNLTYTVYISNTGKAPAQNITVVDTIPSGLEFVNIIPSTCGVTNLTGTSPINFSLSSALNAGQWCMFTYKVHVLNTTADGQYNNTVVVSGNDMDGEPVNSTQPNATETVIIASSIQLEVNKAVDPEIDQPVEAGTVINYTITVANYGENDAVNVNIVDLLPTGLSATGNCWKDGAITCNSGSPVNFTDQNISANSFVVYTVEVSVNSSASYYSTNTVTVNGSTQNGNNDTTNDTETIKVAAPNLKIFKTTSTPTIEPDENATFIITVRNDGTAGAANITINESVDCDVAGTLEYVVGSIDVIEESSASSCTSNIVKTSGGFLVNITLEKGEQCVFTYEMNSTNTTPHNCTNLVMINESYNKDGTLNNQTTNSTSQVEIIPMINVTITKTADRESKKYPPGDVVNYTINLTNDGSSERKFNLHNDTLPAGLVFIGSNCTFENTDNITLSPHTSEICWIAANVTSNASAVTTNTITVGVNDTIYNKSASETIFVMTPYLIIDKASMNNTIINPGDTVAYKVKVTNIGMGDAKNINVTDVLDTGFKHTTGAYNMNPAGCVASNSSTGSNIITFTIDRINGTNGTGNTNNYCTFYYNVSVPESLIPDGVKTNIATITHAEDNNGTPLNETQGNGTSDNGTITVIADYNVNLVKTANMTHAEPGDTINYTINITNSGKNKVFNVTVRETDSYGFDYVNALNDSAVANLTDCGDADALTWCWEISELSGNTVKPLWIVKQINSSANIMSTNTVFGNYTTPGNEIGNLTNTTETVIIGRGRLDIAKRTMTPIAGPHANVTYELTVRNIGDGTAVGVTVRDVLGDVLLTHNSNGTNMSGCPTAVINLTSGLNTSNAVFDIGTLTAGQSCIFTYTVDTDNVSKAVHTNNATASGTDRNGTSLNDSLDRSTVTIDRFTMTDIDKKVNGTNIIYVEPGQVMNFTILVYNRGTTNINNVDVTDTLPAGLTYISGFSGNGTFAYDNSDGTITWDGGFTIPAGTTWNATITMWAPSTADPIQMNYVKATGTSEDGEDQELQAAAFVYVKSPELMFEKFLAAGNENAIPGETITYILRIRNTGDGSATNVNVTDVLDDYFNHTSTVGNMTPAVCNATVSNITVHDNLTNATTAVFNVTNLPGNSVCEFNYTVKLANQMEYDRTYTNLAAIRATDSNNTALEVLYSQAFVYVTVTTDIRINKTAFNTNGSLMETIEPYDLVNWTINVVNEGTNPLFLTTITDILPKQFIPLYNGTNYNVSDQDKFINCTLNPLTERYTCVWNNLTLTPGQTKVLWVIALVNGTAQGGDNTNEVSLVGQNPDGSFVRVSATDSIYVKKFGGIQVHKWANRTDPLEPSDEITWYINITNTAETQINLTMDDLLPQGIDCTTGNNLTVYNMSPTTADQSENNRTRVFSDMNCSVACKPDSGASNQIQDRCIVNFSLQGKSWITFAIPTTVTSDAMEGEDINKVWVHGISPQGEPVEETDTAEVTVEKPGPLNSLDKFALNQNVQPGGTVTYKVRIVNPGTAGLYNLSLEDDLPIGFGHVTSISNVHPVSGTACENLTSANLTYDDSNPDKVIITLTGFVLPAQGVCEITYDTDVDQQLPDGTYINDIKLSSTDKQGTPLVRLEAQAPVNVRSGSLFMSSTKTVNVSFAQPGDNIMYTLITTNEGDNTLTNIVIRDTLPDGIIYTNYTGSFGTSNITAALENFDMGTAISNLTSGGYKRVTNATKELTYGWNSTTGLSSGVWNSSDALLGDFVNGTDSTEFYVNLTANATYEVTIKMGDAVNHNGTGIYVDEDTDYSTEVNVTANTTTTVTFLVNVGDGQLNIIFNDTNVSDGWVVNAINVRKKVTCDFSLSGQDLKWECNSSYLAPFDNITIYVYAYVNSSATLGNNINTMQSNAVTLSGIPIESQDNANFEVRKANLNILKMTTQEETNPAKEVTFIITVTNDGLADAQNVTINDTLPGDFTLNNTYGTNLTVLTLATCKVNNVSQDTSAGKWIVFNITDASGANIFRQQTTCVFQFDVYIPADQANGDYNNTALLTALDMNNSNAPGTPANGTSTVTIVPPQPSITVDKKIFSVNGVATGGGESVPEVQAGDVLNFSIYVRNNVNTDMKNISINDTISDCIINLSETYWENLTLAPYASVTKYITAYVNSSCLGERYNNSVYAQAQTPDNKWVNNSDIVYVDSLKPNLTILKYAGEPLVDQSAAQGSPVRYYILITNVGRADAKNIVINDTFTNGNFTHTATYGAVPGYECGSGITMIGNGTPNAVFTIGGSLSGAPSALGIGGQCLIYYDVNVSTGIQYGTYNNTAVLNATDMNGTKITDLPKESTANITIQPDINLTIDKNIYNSTDDKVNVLGNVQPNQTVNFTITVCNEATDDLYNVSVNDTLPAGFTFIACGSNLTGVTCSNNSALVNWSIIDSFANNTCYEFWVTAYPESTVGIFDTNTATTAAQNATGGVVGPRSSNAYVGVVWPQVTVEKTTLNASRTPNSNVTYQIVVKNVGTEATNNATAKNIVVLDMLPTGNFTYISVAQATGTCTNLTMTVDPADATIANFTITNGLAPGENCTFTFNVHINASIEDGIYTNVAVLNYTDLTGVWIAQYYDNTTSNVRVQQNITITIEKTANDTNTMTLMQPGETIVYNITVNNAGYNILTNTTVTDLLPYGFKCVSGSQSTVQDVAGECGTTSVYYNPTITRTHHTVTWVNQTINGSTAYVYQVTAYINSSADIGLNRNSANVSGTLPNGSSSSKETSYTILVSKPELTIDKINSVSGTTGATPADRLINYTVTIRNTAVFGEGTAKNVQVNDSLEDNFTFTGDVYNDTSNVCNVTIDSGINTTSAVFNVTNLSAGAVCKFTYTVSIHWNVQDGTYINTAIVTGQNLDNGTITNSSAASDVTVLSSVEISMVKTVNKTTARLGDQLNWTITVINTGANSIKNVNITDTIPIKGFTCDSVSSEDNHTGNCTLTGALWTNVTIEPGSETFTIITNVTEDVDSIDLGVNTNNVRLYGQRPDGSWVENYASAEVTIGDKPTIEVVKSMSQHDVEPGSEPITTIIIQNPTYATIYNLSVTDFLPRGFNYTMGTAMLNGRPIDDPEIIGNQSDFACEWTVCEAPGAGTEIGLNVTWRWNETNYTDGAKEAVLDEIPAKTIMVLTFKSHVKCSVCNDTFNNTVNVLGIDNWNSDNVTARTYYEMKGYLANAALYKYSSNNAPVYYEYVDYRIVIWNDPRGANIAPLVLNDTLPAYLQYVSGYAYVGDLKLEPTVCGDYKNRESKDTVQNGTQQGNCTTFGYVDSNKSTPGDTVGQTLYWNLSKWLFLTPGQQVSIKYRTQVIPGIGRTATNYAALSYLDPEHPDVCLDCVFYMDANSLIGIIGAEEVSADTTESYTLKLSNGWTLISIPVKPADTSIKAVLAPIDGKYTDVAAWNGNWEYRSYAYGDWFGNLAAIEPNKGYWIYMKESAELKVTGTTGYDHTVALYEGWNLIGSTSTETKTLSTALASVEGKYLDVATWDNGQWVYRSYAYGDWFGDLNTIEPGKGYWVNMAKGGSKLS